MTPTRLAIATGNAGKLREFEALLEGSGLELIACPVEVEETASTYAGNARLKAEAAVRRTGLPALGDDSGLEVQALGGFPGLRSRRIADTQPERDAIILSRLREVPRPWRARFVCSLVLAVPGGAAQAFRGSVEGELAEAPRGGRGFGYDPLFLVPELGLTFGEMSDERKRRLSHRGRAVEALRRSAVLRRL
ncbi:MAG: RdgB/HAM1 family non-canonical purine NTP pyrophosphatase [Candidatus Dormibacteraceae bacterium]